MDTCRMCGQAIATGDRAAVIAHMKATHVTDGGAVDARTRPTRHLAAVAEERPALVLVPGNAGASSTRFDPMHPVFQAHREPDPTPAA